MAQGMSLLRRPGMAEKGRNMNRPSSTITAATLAGMAVTAAWALVSNFTTLEVSPEVVSSTTTFAVAVVGYFKRERVYKMTPR